MPKDASVSWRGRPMSHYARRTDDNHVAVVDALRAAGVWVVSIANAGNGVPDLLCWARGRYCLIEVKDGTKSPSRQALTAAQAVFHRNCPGELHVVRSPEEAVMRVLQIKRAG
jgi:Holliday junction resolvase